MCLVSVLIIDCGSSRYSLSLTFILLLLYRSAASLSCFATSAAKSTLLCEHCTLSPKLCSLKFKHGACTEQGKKYTRERANFVEGRGLTFLRFWTMQFCCQDLLRVNQGDNYDTLKNKAVQANYKSTQKWFVWSRHGASNKSLIILSCGSYLQEESVSWKAAVALLSSHRK